ncbi:MAG: APC family permease [Bryobacteraceae bacterium]
MAAPTSIMTPAARELPRKLSFVDALAIVAGTMIGSAIFIVPSTIAQTLPSTASIVSVWVVAGVITFFGALAFAELGAMMPATGGQYAHLREAYGPLWGFLFGWALFLVIRSGGTATLAVGFSIYLGQFLPLSPITSKLAALALIGALTWVNYRGVRQGAAVQKTFTLLKVLGLVILIGSAVLSGAPSKMTWEPATISLNQFGVAMIACLWAYQGWFAVSWVAGEVQRPERNLPLSLVLGVGIVMAIYLSANFAYLHVLTLPEIMKADRVASLTAERVMGPIGSTFVSLAILVSIVGATNSGLLAGPRVYFAQARDGLFFAKFGEVHPRFETPAFSVLMQSAWAAVLAASGSYEKLFSYVIFTSWIFYGMTVAAVIVLRRKQPNLPRPYKMWGYPITPVLFVLVTAGFVVNTIFTKPGPSLIGLLLVATGVPVYYAWRVSARRQ